MMNRRCFFQSSLAAAVAYALPTPRLYAVDQAASQAAGGLAAVKLDGSATVIEQAAVAELKASLRGPLLLAGDAGYDSARRILHPQFDKHPALIVQPTGAADVRNAVTFARERELLAGREVRWPQLFGQVHLRRRHPDRPVAAARRAGRSRPRVGPTSKAAACSGDLDHEVMAYGLVTTAGTVSHTGSAASRSAAVSGALARRFGLALDNVKSVDIVTADGQLRHASAEENPDLYWAVRGGGGNFGIVTGFEFGLHPMQRRDHRRRRGLSDRAGARAARVLRRVQPTARPTSCMSTPAWTRRWAESPARSRSRRPIPGPAADAERVFAPLRKLGKPIEDTIKAQDYVAIQRSWDQTDPRNNGEYLKSGFIVGYPAGLVDAVMDGFQPDPARGTSFFTQHAGGAIGRVAPDATAFPHRRSTIEIFAMVSWDLAKDGKQHTDYIKDYWSKLLPFTDGYYTNEVADEHQPKIDENYRGNIGRLRQLKRQYDPQNLFRLNANILPA